MRSVCNGLILLLFFLMMCVCSSAKSPSFSNLATRQSNASTKKEHYTCCHQARPNEFIEDSLLSAPHLATRAILIVFTLHMIDKGRRRRAILSGFGRNQFQQTNHASQVDKANNIVDTTVAIIENRPKVQSWRPQLPRRLTPWKWNECGWTYTCTNTIM